MRYPDLEAQAERGELSRYVADYLAARAPLGISLAAGAVAALGVYVVPIAVVLVSFVLLRLAYLAVVPVSALVVALFRWAAGAPQRGPAAPAAVPTAPGPLPVPTTSIEPMMDPGGRGELWAVALVVFWPVAMLAIGMVTAAVYRARRARRLADLSRHPVDFSILPEVVLFYALTAAAALLVGLD
ncbi:MAG: hypothetical protein M3442_15820, partial [Chloroflexota bacterium]|nr:hypothetical protein [Chloroflexota bacterium]